MDNLRRFAATLKAAGPHDSRSMRILRASTILAALSLGAIVFCPEAAQASEITLGVTDNNVSATAQPTINVCYNPVSSTCGVSHYAATGQVAVNYVAPVPAGFDAPQATANLGSAAAKASLFGSPNPLFANTGELTATASATSLYLSGSGSASIDGSLEILPAPGNNSGQVVPVVVIGTGNAVATGNGYAYADLEVSGYGADDTFPTVEAEAQTNYAYPEAPNEGPSFSVDQTIMLEPDTVAGVYMDANAFAGEPLQDPVFQEPLAIGCPTYCGTASASLDPLIEIEPAFLAANPGYTLVFSPGFVPPLSAPVPEPSTCAMLLLGFIGLGFTGSRASRRRGALAGPASPFVDSSS
jgi:hypothetical protein